MSRARFNKFVDGKFLDSIGEKIGFENILEDASVDGKRFLNDINAAVKARQEVENTVNSKKKYVARIARAKDSMYEEDLKEAQRLLDELYENKDVTENQYNTFSKMLDKVNRRSYDIRKSAKEQADQEKSEFVKKKISEMTEEDQLSLQNAPLNIKLQLLASVGTRDNIVEQARVYGVKVDRKSGTVEFEAEFEGKCP
jgi:hypothetical protein